MLSPASGKIESLQVIPAGEAATESVFASNGSFECDTYSSSHFRESHEATSQLWSISVMDLGDAGTTVRMNGVLLPVDYV